MHPNYPIDSTVLCDGTDVLHSRLTSTPGMEVLFVCDCCASGCS